MRKLSRRSRYVAQRTWISEGCSDMEAKIEEALRQKIDEINYSFKLNKQ